QSLPKLAKPHLEQEVEGFAASKPARAIAIAPLAQRPWRTAGWPNAEIAQEKALEKCQQYFDEPCALIATNELIVASSADGNRPARDAPRVRYSGMFNPERIPGIRREVAERMDVAGYSTAPAPKASAYHAVGILHVAVGASSQRAAEEQVLRACNDDPARK